MAQLAKFGNSTSTCRSCSRYAANYWDRSRSFALLTCHSPDYDSARLSACFVAAGFAKTAADVDAGELWLATADGRKLHAGCFARWRQRETASGRRLRIAGFATEPEPYFGPIRTAPSRRMTVPLRYGFSITDCTSCANSSGVAKARRKRNLRGQRLSQRFVRAGHHRGVENARGDGDHTNSESGQFTGRWQC